jgi:L-iditol 2-dehydrogenase
VRPRCWCDRRNRGLCHRYRSLQARAAGDGGRRAAVQSGFTPGHEYTGAIIRLGPTVDEFQTGDRIFQIGDRIAIEVHAGCGRCQRCHEGMYTSCLNYGYRDKGHRANGCTSDGGFAEYAVNNINTMV